ncbi:MAG: hypothetical protein AAGH74_09780 [Pseudomonadota bacterium]
MKLTAIVAAAALAIGQIAPAYAQAPVQATTTSETVEKGGLARAPLDDIGELEATAIITIIILLGVGLAIGLGGGSSDNTSTPNTN